MAMLAVTLAITALYATALRKDARFWERSRARRVTLKGLATLSLVLWIGVVAAGRLIAYI